MEPYEHIKTLKDACEATGENYSKLSAKPLSDQFEVIIKAINGGWEADYKNTNQYKYIPYFPSDHDLKIDDIETLDMGFKTHQMAEHFTKYFVPLKIKTGIVTMKPKEIDMTVKDLIEHLKQLKQMSKVFIDDPMRGDVMQLNTIHIRQSSRDGEDAVYICN